MDVSDLAATLLAGGDDGREAAGRLEELASSDRVQVLQQVFNATKWARRYDAAEAVLEAGIDVRPEAAELVRQGADRYGAIGQLLAELVLRNPSPQWNDALVASLDRYRREGASGTAGLAPRKAMRALALTGDESAIAALVPLLDRETTRTTAITALGEFGPAAAPRLVDALIEGNDSLREGATLALRSPVFDAAPLLAAAADGSRPGVDPKARLASLRIMTDLDPQMVVEPARNAMTSPNVALRAAAARALAASSVASDDMVARISSDRDERVRAAFADGYAQRRDAGAASGLVRLASDRSKRVRTATGAALAAIGPAAVPKVAELFTGSKWQRQAAEAAFERMDPRGVREIGELVAADNTELRLAALRSLLGIGRRYGPQQGLRLQQIRIALDDADAQTRELAGSVIATHQMRGGARALENVVLRHLDASAARSLLEIGGGTPSLLRLLQSSGPATIQVVCEAMYRDIGLAPEADDWLALYAEPSRWFGWRRAPDGLTLEPHTAEIANRLHTLAIEGPPEARAFAMATLNGMRRRLAGVGANGGYPAGTEFFMAPEPIPLSPDVESLTAAGDDAKYTEVVLIDPAGQPVPATAAVIRDKLYELLVNISKHQRGIPVQEAKPVVDRLVAPLLVVVTGSGIDVAEPTQRLQVPAEGSATPARFVVTPRIDPAVLEVTIYAGMTVIDRIALKSKVVAGALPGAVGEPSIEARSLPRPIAAPADERPLQLAIEVARTSTGAFSLKFIADSANAQATFQGVARGTLRPDDISSLVERARSALLEISLGDPMDRPGAIKRLSNVGREFWQRLFEARRADSLAVVGEWLKTNPLPQGSPVRVTYMPEAAELVIPWSILYDHDWDSIDGSAESLHGFWGNRFRIEQVSLDHKPSMRTSDSQPAIPFFTWPFKETPSQLVLLRELAGSLSPDRKIVQIEGAKTGYSELSRSRATLIVFFSHGFTPPQFDASPIFAKLAAQLPPQSKLRKRLELQVRGDTEQTGWVGLRYGKMLLPRLYTATDLSGAPLVLLNMCESAQVWPSFSNSFVDLFLTRGAGAVVGTECEVQPAFGDQFASALFGQLRGGASVGDALFAVRSELAETGDARGLLYTLFGDGRTTLAMEAER